MSKQNRPPGRGNCKTYFRGATKGSNSSSRGRGESSTGRNQNARKEDGGRNSFNRPGRVVTRDGVQRGVSRPVGLLHSSRPRPERAMSFMYVKRLTENLNTEQVILELSNPNNAFLKLLDSKNLSNDLIVILVKLIKRICQCTFQQTQIALLTVVLQSNFMGTLTVYIAGLMVQNEQDKGNNSFLWDALDEFWDNLLTFSWTVQEVIPTYCNAIQNLLKVISVCFDSIEKHHCLYISDEIKNRTTDLLVVVENTVDDLSFKKTQAEVVKRQLEPPNNYREIDIIPSAQEVVNPVRPFLRENIIDKPFYSVDEYLDIHFRLLREDFVAPLRRGIFTFLSNQGKPKNERKKVEDVRIYPHVRFLTFENVNDCNCYKVKFDNGQRAPNINYEKSKRFLYGSLLCLTMDLFQTVMFAKVVNRDLNLLKKGEVVIGFQENVKINFNTSYIMVESSVYFEPYYHVLRVLQQLNEDNFPMKKYIIEVETNSFPPEYLIQEIPIQYTFENVTFEPLKFPKILNINLNKSQKKAYMAALSNEFSIIQGPPGTGKTFLGLTIAHTLINNKSAWWKKSPMLVICYTNHALDQFLEGIISVTERVIRVGGQSKNDALKEYNLNSKKVMNHYSTRQTGQQLQACIQFQRDISEMLGIIEGCSHLLNFGLFAPHVKGYEKSWFFKTVNKDIIFWLLEGKQGQVWEYRDQNYTEESEPMAPVAQSSTDNLDLHEKMFEPVDLDYELFEPLHSENSNNFLLSVQVLEKSLTDLRRDLNLVAKEWSIPENSGLLNLMMRCESLEMEIWDTESTLRYLKHQLLLYRNIMNRNKPQHIDMKHPFKMSYADRWQLYFYWTDQYAKHLRQTHEEYNLKFRNLYLKHNEMREMENTQIMADNLVVGMTTTGAARLRSSLQALKSPIVIVEEAAEVLESHIVTALTDNCQHLILIGDHLQLKPGTADYYIETKYKFGVSLFERMVRNNIQHHTLDVQHRMRPEISQLVKPHIYANLEDHKSTLQRPHIFGVDKCLYFIDHQEPEEMCQDDGKKNVHESKFLIALARHLILNGYSPEQITILSSYLGQFYEMLSERNAPQNSTLLQDVRIAVLDNYQGEESDIILLSLVRNNKENNAGFLRIQNRVCVALSRARDGMYIMGNMNLLLNCNSENQIWQKVNKVLKLQDAIGSELTLRCQVHQYKYTGVSRASDFHKLVEGGCDLMCESALECGHICKRLCHVKNRDHIDYKCLEKCNKSVCNMPFHLCQKMCYIPCGDCMYMVSRVLDKCGHTVQIACSINPITYHCLEPVFTKLPCGHETNKPCWANRDMFTCPFPCDTRVEPCGHQCKLKCHMNSDPDHLQYKCSKKCSLPKLRCSQADNPHACQNMCFEECQVCKIPIKKHRSCGHVFYVPCSTDVESVCCEKPCKLILPCGHACINKCSAKCLCEAMVEKIIDECQHSVKIQCSVAVKRAHCNSRSCPRLLRCGHKCHNACKDPCTEVCTTIVDCDILGPCGHLIKKIPCYLKHTTDRASILLEACTEPCSTELKCKHPCKGTCGECAQGKIHKRCAEKCGVPLICNHECIIPCREACKPCTRKCQMRCPHSKCGKMCGAPCTQCKSACPRKCEHIRCRKKCGEICDVKPCEERCKKRLQCGHPCVGFCGDPCPPLCRECHKDELTETFFGTEDDEDAIFVLLADCKHVLEHSGLETWLEQNADRIQYKTCPKCKQVITSNQRYNNYIKQACLDVINAKKKSYGDQSENEALRKQLNIEVMSLNKDFEYCSLVVQDLTLEEGIFTKTRFKLQYACPELKEVLRMLEARLRPVKNKRIQPINKMELNAIRSKIQSLSHITECFLSDPNPELNSLDPGHASVSQLQALLKVLLRSDDHVTNQEIEDLQIEIKRLERIVQYERIRMIISSSTNCVITNTSVMNQILVQKKDIKKQLFAPRRYSYLLDEILQPALQTFAYNISTAVVITSKEKVDIVKAIGLSTGHWFKCPNGHPYVIGECGGAMEISMCFCGAQIGGTHHHLLNSNELASEMDGATRHAFPGGLH